MTSIQDWITLLAIATGAIAFFSFLWLNRVRSTKRWEAVLSDYAAREIARQARTPRAVSSLSGGFARTLS
jgi:hypothetical protein